MNNVLLADGVLKEITQMIVETSEENPVIIVKITPDFIDVADGYRVRLTPKYKTQEQFDLH